MRQTKDGIRFQSFLWIKILNKPLLQDNFLLSSGKCMNGIWYFLHYSKSNSSYLKVKKKKIMFVTELPYMLQQTVYIDSKLVC